MAVPISVPEKALELAYESSSHRKQAVGDLVTIAFYFLLRSGEYTKPRKVKRNGKMVRATRTVQFRSSEIVAAVRAAAKALKLHDRGIDPDMIGAHSLRAGGAMALKIMGYKDSTIRKFGRWTSDTWMMYIHSQISKLYEGVAQDMSTPL
eukprot:scaffold3199_cov232-Chaetoceros_neogracile.AAC.1